MEPTCVSAGESISWTRVIAGHSADDGWSAIYYLKNGSNVLPKITCAGAGNLFTASVSVATSAAWAPGTYQWTLFAEKETAGTVTDRIRIGNGEIEVLANPVTATVHDGRSLAAKMVEALGNLLQRAADNPSTSLSLSTPSGSSRSKTFKTLEEVEKSLAKWNNVLRAEQDAARIRSGKISRRIQKINFTG